MCIRDRSAAPPSTFPPVQGGALALLDRRPTTADVPDFTVGSNLVKSSFRLLHTSTQARSYIARAKDGRICLAAYTVDQLVAATCASRTAFAREPLRLDLTVTQDPTSDSGADAHVEILISLSPDGADEYRYLSAG